MIKTDKQFELKISTVDFIITPQQISFKASQPHEYFIQFDKGAQILKKFDEKISISSSRASYIFTNGEQGRFKLQTERNCSCEWGVYLTSSNEMSQFVDSLPINLHEYYTAFANTFKPIQNEYLRILAERGQGREISKLWEAMKARLQWQFPEITCKNRSNSIEIRFRLEVRCEADSWSEAEKKKAVKSTKSIRSNGDKLNNSFKKETNEEEDLLPKFSTISPPEPPKEEPKQIQNYKINQAPPQMEMEPMLKKGSVLSDIIECSVECSSNMNQRQKRNQLKEISGIPEEQSEMYSPYLPSLANTKTQNFEVMGNKQYDDILKRRSNTFHSDYNELPQEMEQNLADSKHSSTPDYINRDEELEKQELQDAIQTLPHSEIKPTEQEIVKENPIKKNGRAKYVILFVICLIFIGALAFSAHLENRDEKPQEKKMGGKAKKIQQRKNKMKRGKQ